MCQIPWQTMVSPLTIPSVGTGHLSLGPTGANVDTPSLIGAVASIAIHAASTVALFLIKPSQKRYPQRDLKTVPGG